MINFVDLIGKLHEWLLKLIDLLNLDAFKNFATNRSLETQHFVADE